jgi:outer membrane lipoprotein-sorting protein
MERRTLLLLLLLGTTNPVFAQPNLPNPDQITQSFLKRLQARQNLLGKGFQVTQQTQQTVHRGNNTDQSALTFLVSYTPPTTVNRTFESGTRNGQPVSAGDLENPIRQQMEKNLSSLPLLTGNLGLNDLPQVQVLSYEPINNTPAFKLQITPKTTQVKIDSFLVWVDAKSYDPLQTSITVTQSDLNGTLNANFSPIGPKGMTLLTQVQVKGQARKAFVQADLTADLRFQNYQFR